MKTKVSINEYIAKNDEWKSELEKLYSIALSLGLDETIKWGYPVFTLENKNIVGIAAFKSYCGLWFFQGALLKDNEDKLINAQKDKTKAQRQWRFQSLKEIEGNSDLIKKYIAEAIENQKLGKEIKPDRRKPLNIPEELQSMLDDFPEAKIKFVELPLTKKREFAEYISEAKRESTKTKRLEKITPMILKGIGLNDKYK